MAKPEHIQKYDNLTKHKKRILDTTKRHHIEAYYHAIDDVLKKEGEEHPNYDLLKESKHQLAFADKISDFYVKKAKDYFKVQKDLGDLEKDMLINAYAGVTKAELRELLGQYEDKYDIDVHKKGMDKIIQAINKRLTGATQSHFIDDHIKDLLETSGADKYLKADTIQLPEAILIYDQFKEAGVISKKMLENIGIAKYKFKKEVAKPVKKEKAESKAA